MTRRVKYTVPPIGEDSAIVFRDLVVTREKNKDPLLGCQEVKTFIEVDDDTLAAVDAIKRAGTLRAADALLTQERGESFDLIDLTSYLAERGFVRSVDGVEVTSDSERFTKTHFAHVPAAAVRWIHSRTVLIGVPVLMFVALAVGILDHRYMPDARDVFLFDYQALNIVLPFAIMLLNTYVHELAHLFMARSFDVVSSIRFSNRMHILVMETDVTNAWVLPPAKRALIFLAGMGYNVFMWSACVLVAAAIGHGLIPAPQGLIPILMFFGFLNTIPITFQFMFWIRTDLYFAALTLTGERNLRGDSAKYVSYYFRRLGLLLRGRAKDRCGSCAKRVHAEDPFCHACGTTRTVRDPNKYPFNYRARWIYLGYGALMAVFMPAMIYLLARVIIFVQTENVIRAWVALMRSIPAGNLLLITGDFLVLLVTVGQVALIGYFMGRSVVGMAVKTAFRTYVLGLRAKHRLQRSLRGPAPLPPVDAVRGFTRLTKRVGVLAVVVLVATLPATAPPLAAAASDGAAAAPEALVAADLSAAAPDDCVPHPTSLPDERSHEAVRCASVAG